MKEYHSLRRTEKAIKDEKIIAKMLKEQPYLTIALSNDNNPYLVTLNYVYDAEKKSFYIHCANSGKKNEGIYKENVIINTEHFILKENFNSLKI